MSNRRTVNRNLQRQARALAADRDISYMQAIRALDARSQRDAADVPPTFWVKSMFYRWDGWTIRPGAQTWISDVGRRKSDGTRIYRSDGVAAGEPGWRADDEIGIYLKGTRVVPVLVRVVSRPRFDPEWVQTYNDGGEPDAGERWPWVTDVLGIAARDLATAPTLAELEISPQGLQSGHKVITADQHARLRRGLGL